YNNSEGTLTLSNSIVALSARGGDIANYGDLLGSHNLVGDGSGLSDWLSGDPGLGPLQDNGGPTRTMALLSGSRAIDAGDSSLVPPGVTTDQCGRDRIAGPAVDLGAVEFDGSGDTDELPPGETALRDSGSAVSQVTPVKSDVNSLVVVAL